jgi:dTDP-4-dehydrorhamnose reductase
MNNYRILILGHTGLLGNAVYKYLENNPAFTLFTINGDFRFPSKEYLDKIIEAMTILKVDYIINCCGAIHQRTKNFEINYKLPEFLIENCLENTKVINISTTCVFDGLSGFPYSSSSVPNATSEYGLSKIEGDEIFFANPSNNFKVLRTSIIGIDKDKSSLLSWFLSQSKGATIQGFSAEFWQGVTTLKLAEVIEDSIFNWKKYNKLTTISSKYSYSKYDLLYLFRELFDRKDIKILVDNKRQINKSIIGDIITTDFEVQLKELKGFYEIK